MCVCVELMDCPPLLTMLASSCEKCRESIYFTSTHWKKQELKDKYEYVKNVTEQID